MLNISLKLKVLKIIFFQLCYKAYGKCELNTFHDRLTTPCALNCEFILILCLFCTVSNIFEYIVHFFFMLSSFYKNLSSVLMLFREMQYIYMYCVSRSFFIFHITIFLLLYIEYIGIIIRRRYTFNEWKIHRFVFGVYTIGELRSDYSGLHIIIIRL